MTPRSFRWDWLRLALVIWISLAVGLAAYSFLYPHDHTVFNIYALATQRWWSGQNIYLDVQGTDYYRYSPLFAIAITPLALLPESWGSALWRIFNCAAYAAGLWACARHLLPASLNRNQIGALFLLALPVSLHSMFNGQANVLMLASILFGLAAAAENRWNRAAGWLAVATLIKGYPLGLALLLAALFPRRFALRFAVALSLGLLLPFATARPSLVMSQYASWWDHLNASTTIMRERLRTLEHLFAVYGHPVTPHTFMICQVLGGLAILGLCYLQARRASNQRQLLTMILSFFSVWVVLFGPATETCTYVVIAPAIAWAIVESFLRPAAWTTRFLLISSLPMMGPCTTDMVGPLIRNFANEHGSQPIGGILFFIHLLIQFVQSLRAPAIGQAQPGMTSLNAAA